MDEAKKNKIRKIINEYRNGNLKDKDGNKIDSFGQALAMAVARYNNGAGVLSDADMASIKKADSYKNRNEKAKAINSSGVLSDADVARAKK